MRIADTASAGNFIKISLIQLHIMQFIKVCLCIFKGQLNSSFLSKFDELFCCLSPGGKLNLLLGQGIKINFVHLSSPVAF